MHHADGDQILTFFVFVLVPQTCGAMAADPNAAFVAEAQPSMQAQLEALGVPTIPSTTYGGVPIDGPSSIVADTNVNVDLELENVPAAGLVVEGGAFYSLKTPGIHRGAGAPVGAARAIEAFDRTPARAAPSCSVRCLLPSS